MVKIVGNDIWRGGQKVGWIDGDHIRAMMAKDSATLRRTSCTARMATSWRTWRVTI